MTAWREQGADSCELVSFTGLLNRSEQSVQKCTENMLIWGIVSRRGTSSLETNEILKVYKSVQLFSGGVRSLWMQKKSVQSVQKCTDLYVCFPVGYELFENNIFSAHILASGSCVSVETMKYLRHFSRCWVLVECQWRHQKPGDLPATGTQVYQIETESEPCFKVLGTYGV